MDSTRYVIKRNLNCPILRYKASYDAASTIHRIMNPRFMSNMASYDVASTILCIINPRH